MRRKITNPELLETIKLLRSKATESKAEIWDTVAEELSSSRARRAQLNLNHISRATAKDSVVLVPGKVLGDGALRHPVVVSAFRFSETARAKIEQAGGKCVTIKDLVSRYPKGSKIQILR